jgi:hypothetical protein
MLERLRDGVQNLYYICEETRATNRHGATISGGEGGPRACQQDRGQTEGQREAQRVQKQITSKRDWPQAGLSEGEDDAMWFALCAAALQRGGRGHPEY